MGHRAGHREWGSGLEEVNVKLKRIVDEGYGDNAWHGSNLKMALADVTPELAFWRPAADRHNIAEIALHHAWCTRSVRGQLSAPPSEPFLLDGEDWFPVSAGGRVTWPQIHATLNAEQDKLSAIVASLKNDAQFDLVLGITCHAIYHAGQVQLIKRLHEE